MIKSFITTTILISVILAGLYICILNPVYIIIFGATASFCFVWFMVYMILDDMGVINND